MKLTGKTREELSSALAGKTHAELLELIFSLLTVEQLVSAGEIARRSLMSRRDVLADMKAGKFVDPLFGRGFFCRGSNSLKVSGSAVNAWRRSFFAPLQEVGQQPATLEDSLPPRKRGKLGTRQTGVESANLQQNSGGHGFGLSVELERK